MSKVNFNNSYAKLPENFYSNTNPDPVKQPNLIKFNHELAEELGVTGLYADEAEAVEFFSGNKIPEGAEPIAMAYSGHQFGGFRSVKPGKPQDRIQGIAGAGAGHRDVEK